MNFICSIAGTLGVPMVNGSAANQQSLSMPIIGQPALGASAIPAPVIPSPTTELIGFPSECLLLKNMFDPATEVFHLFAFVWCSSFVRE